VVEATPTLDGSANVETVQIPPAAEQVSGATPADNSPSLWLLIIAVGLLIVGMIVLFGRRRKDNGK
jgi:LPXTG-motif cell wall-anchored protein